MNRMEALERKYKNIASKTTKELDSMSVAELKALRGNMIGWLEAATGDTAIVIGEDGKRGPSLYDFAAVEFALRQVETEIAWRRKERE